MSRICVKNLPKHVAEDQLREIFSKKGEITDAKLIRTSDGKSRQFAFIGFRTEQEALEAIKYFNKSYLGNLRIACEIARKVGDPDIPRPWSRHSVKKQDKTTEPGKTSDSKISNLGSHQSKAERGDRLKDSENDDPQLREFLQVMQPRTKSKLWENDTPVAPVASTSNEKHVQKTEVGRSPVSANIEQEKRNNVEKEIIDASKHLQNPLQDGVSDMDYFKSRVKKDWSESESSEDEDDNDNRKDRRTSFSNESSLVSDDEPIDSVQEHNSMRKDSLLDEVVKEDTFLNADGEETEQGSLSPSPKDDNEEKLKSGRLFVRNLPYSATEEELEELFCKFGKITDVHLVVDKDTKRSKGIAYVQYQLPESAARALEEFDNSIFQGRLLHVMPAAQKSNPDKQEDISVKEAPKTLKQQREEQRKALEASGDTRAWNTLYMRSDTVVENVARKFGVSKSDFLDREADDLAVRIALGETQVISETKKALAEAGVNVAALEEFAAHRSDATKRSNHVLLVKNLPYGSSGAELAKMFGKYGSLDRIVLPPTKTMALVIFLESSEARAAFKGLAYKRYKDAPLYLEWAPGNILNQAPSDGNQNGAIIGEEDAKRVLFEQRVEGLSDVDLDPDRVEARSLFVKNLSFKTTDEALKSHFDGKMKGGKILSVKIKKHIKNGKLLSMGFGFIEFDSMETATNVCDDLQGTILDGHALILQHCQVKKDDQKLNKGEKDKSSTKLLIRNVAFEATEKDLRKLFSSFGKIKSLRLPMKFGSHRGFAFVEFVTKQEAENALKALSNTHLYGRHLVLEKAKEGETLEELRARTAAQFTDEQNGFQNPTKLSKKRKHTAVLDEGRVKFEKLGE